MAKVKEDKDLDDFLDSVEVNPEDARDATHFRRIIAAQEAVEAADAELTAAVAAAREAGDTWDMIGTALGTSRQGAYQRFGRSGKLSSDEVVNVLGLKRVSRGRKVRSE